jgi:hypothetical protein
MRLEDWVFARTGAMSYDDGGDFQNGRRKMNTRILWSKGVTLRSHPTRLNTPLNRNDDSSSTDQSKCF